MKKLSSILMTAALFAAIAGSAGPANAALTGFSPSLTFDGTPDATGKGMPIWFQGQDGTAVQPCIVPGCGLLPAPPGTLQAGKFPVTFPGNYPAEAFYFNAQSPKAVPIGTTGVTCDIFAALEFTTFDPLTVKPGVAPTTAGISMATFQRLRLAVQGTVATGTWTVDHPWGTTTFDAVSDCKNQSTGCQMTRDVPLPAPNDFLATLGPSPLVSSVQFTMDTFLRQVSIPPPPGFLGDALNLSTFSGGTVRQFFQITDPNGQTTGPLIFATIIGKTAGLDISPTGVQDFGLWVVGATSTPKTFTITNLTGAPTTDQPIITPPVGYSITATSCIRPLTAAAPGNTCTFDVSFAPTANGIVSGNVTIDAAPAPPALIAVTGDGEGTIPSVAITGITQFTTLTSQLLSGTASDFGNPVASVTVSLNAGPPQPATYAAGNWSINLTGLTPNAVNNIAATATDTALPAGNTNTVNASIIVDTIPPAVSLTAPANGSLTNITAPVLTFTATDTNLATTLVKVDGTIVNKVSGNTLAPLADGLHTVAVDALDAAGTHTIVTNSITVDATPPVIAVTSPKVVNGRLGVKTPALTVSVTDANPVPANTVVKLDNVVVTGAATIGPFVAGSSHTLTVDTTDGAGNISNFTTGPFTIVFADGRVLDPAELNPVIADALATLKHIVNITPLTADQFAHADVAPLDANGVPNPDGTVGIADALLILKRIVGLITTF